MSGYEILYAVTALLFYVVLIIHYALRRWRFALAMREGRLVYGLSLAAAVVSIILLLGDQPWWMWLGGFLYVVWAAYGYYVDYVAKIEWRTARRWPVMVPYLVLYLATCMFYWWPLDRLSRPLWIAATALFIISTALNVTSHKSAEELRELGYR